MCNKFEYIFDNETGLLTKNYYGDISIEDIEQSWDKAISDKIINSEVRGILLDYRSATFIFKISDYKLIGEYYKKNIEYFLGKRIAVLSEKPRDVAIPILVKELDDGYESQAFTSYESAKKWALGHFVINM